MQIKIRDYIVSISRGKLTEREAAAIPELLHCVNDAERISDLALKVYRKTSRVQSSRISSEAIEGISAVSKKVRQLARSTIEILMKTKMDVGDISTFEKEIHEFTKATARTLTLHMKDQGDGSKNDIAVLSVLSALRDIARHLGNIAVRIPTI